MAVRHKRNASSPPVGNFTLPRRNKPIMRMKLLESLLKKIKPLSKRNVTTTSAKLQPLPREAGPMARKRLQRKAFGLHQTKKSRRR